MLNLTDCPSIYSALYGVANFCRKTGEVVVLVPDKLSLFMEKFVFEQLNLTSSFDILISTLNRFAKKTLTIDKSKQISKNGSIILIHKILSENGANFKVLKSGNYNYSYAENIYATIMQLKASKITANEMFGFECENKNLQNKILDLALIYSQYEEGKAGLLDSSDQFLMSTLTLDRDVQNKNILFVGFDDFTEIEYSIIEQLIKNNNVTIFNYNSTSTNKYIFNSEVYEQLKKIAYTCEQPFTHNNLEIKCDDFKEFLFKNLYAIKKENFNLYQERFKIYSANTLDEEIEFIARDIRTKILNGANYDDFGVAVFNLDGKEEKFKEIFAKYQINYYIDNNFTLNKSIFYKFLVDILKYSIKGSSVTTLIDIINSPFFCLDELDKEKLIDRLINFKSSYKSVANFDFGQELSEQKQNLVNFLNIFKINKASTIENFIKLIKNADNLLNFNQIIEEINKKVDLTEQILLTKSRDVVLEVLDEIEKFYPNADMEIVFDVLTHIVSSVKINNLPLTIDAVKVVEAGDNMEIFNNLYLANVTKQDAPSLKYDCGIILDNEIDKLNFAHKLSPTIAHLNKLKRLRVFNALTLFENSLTLSFSAPCADCVTDLAKFIKINKKSVKIYSKFNYSVHQILSTDDLIDFASTNKINLKNELKNNKKCAKNDENNEFFKNFYNLTTNRIPQILNNKNIFKDLKNISPSQLESYFVCPFSSFLKYSLRIKPRMADNVQTFDVGNILHEILRDYYAKACDVGDIYEFCKNKVFDYVKNVERLKLDISNPMLINLIDEAVRVISGMQYIDKNTKFMPFKQEFEFNNNFALKLKDANIIGKVDRIDKYNDLYRIVDYKSGKVDTNLAELYYGNKLQLFLYSLAVENIFGKTVGCFYLPLHNEYTVKEGNNYALKGYFINDSDVVSMLDNRLEPLKKSDIVNIAATKEMTARRIINYDFENLKNYTLRLTNNAISDIKSGYISPSPSEVSSPCKYCEFASICLPKSSSVKERVCNKVNGESFKEVEDEKI